MLDLSAVDVSALSLKARPDLVPPAVGLTCNASVISRIIPVVYSQIKALYTFRNRIKRQIPFLERLRPCS